MRTFEPVELDYRDMPENDYPFLEDDMHEKAKQLLTEEFGVDPEQLDFKLFYSLSYSQGDGTCFNFLHFGNEMEKVWKACSKEKMPEDLQCYIKHAGGHYYHENSMDISFNCDDCKQGINEADETLKYKIQKICKQLATCGYAMIEHEDKWQLEKEVLRRFYELNKIEADAFDYDVEHEGGEGLVYIGKAGTQKLYANLSTITEHKREVVEDGLVIRTETFYTL